MKRAVVKLGGSTAQEAERAVWVAALASSRLPLIVVPGGGPFANLVRATQEGMGFSDTAAHAMAILAMDQFGHVVLDCDSRFAPAHTLADIERLLGEDRVPVWLPSRLALAAPDIEASWEITSDALAAWLAGRVGADGLLLIKQSRDFSACDDIAGLRTKGILDAAFARMLPATVEFRLASPEDAASAAALLAEGRLPGVCVVGESERVGRGGRS